MWLACGSLTRELRDGEMVVGSGADADWRVATADLMPRHFTLVVHGLNASLRAASRDNLVVVNGRPLGTVPYLLNDGDVIEAGSGRFLFTDGPPQPAAAERPMAERAYLVDERGAIAFPILKRSTTLGRDGSNTIVVADPRASRFHAEIRREAGGFVLHSMGSAGTLVNGRLLEGACLLAEGDRIQIAFVTYRFSRAEPAPEMRVAGADAAESGDARRRPTLTTAQISVGSDNEAGRGAAAVRLAVAVVVALAVIGWLLFGR